LGIQRAIHDLRDTNVPFLKERRDVLEVYVFSKLWYLAQSLPLPQAASAKATSLACSFLWLGYLERLAWQELHNREAGGLRVSCVLSRGQALFSKQHCHQAAAGGTAAHLAFWLGQAVGHDILCLAVHAHAHSLLAPLFRLCEVLKEIFTCNTVPPNSPEQATAAGIYAAFMD
jgi:hypothetical protein